MKSRTAALLAAAALLSANPADALHVARATRRGYVVVDDDAAAYGGQAPNTSAAEELDFIAQLSLAVALAPDVPRTRYIAVLQLDYLAGANSLAYYFPLRNDTLGIGQRDPFNSGRETFDLNGNANTSFPIDAFLALNSVNYYINPALRDFGLGTLCTQEFAHRYTAFVRVPAVAVGGDGGAVAPTALLGRSLQHWSYFLDTGGSPMEGNAWEESSPGVFRTRPASNLFSWLDLYLMGMAAPSEVPPFFVIADPDTTGATDVHGGPLSAASAPERDGRTVTIAGRRVTLTVDDLIRANGPRVPAYAPGDGGVAAGADYDVLWVLLATEDRADARAAAVFDAAVDACSAAWHTATRGRSRLVARGGTGGDAGDDAGPDGGDAGAAAVDSGGADAGVPALTGGCACRAPRAARGGSAAAWIAAVGAGAIGLRRRRRGTSSARRRRSVTDHPQG